MITSQTPIGSGFTAASTVADVMRDIDLAGKIAIVTGGYSGLGLETVKAFVEAGARVIVPARDVERARVQMGALANKVEIEAMDLLSPTTIDAFAEQFLATGAPLHILVNSAGIMALPELRLDPRGYEYQFATNHLGHFQLVSRLWPALVKAGGARVISVSSLGHSFSPVIFEDLNFSQRAYDPWAGYGQSKTANILFAVELDKRGKSSGVRAFSLHPGAIPDTGLGVHVPDEVLRESGMIDKQGNAIIDPAKGVKTIQQGAATQVWCAVSPQLEGVGGVYCEDVEIAAVAHSQPVGLSVLAASVHYGVKPYALDGVAASRLWSVSEEMLGRAFDI
ncbi:SDR family NAD(P)-dependent oxidoreductase [Pseudomonas nabeulensis]|uniref:Probable oxidoreductase n=1 Tax=Pseudomonas nabeulensis TaxID=2293833 RepID=A0A4Z0AGR3_9PSED|nr:SDR family NAD(P)-dependent oxidoreductase [Pseudomonas nabeulensis]TFY85523.1 SDR family NAD(P)-dependent oxidoreductase [Pseudomonas nabeulensis]